MKRIGFWIAMVLLLAVTFPIAAGNWSRATTIGLSWVGRASIFAVFVVGATLGGWMYLRDSSSRFGTAQQINLRERDRSAWLRRGIRNTVGLGIICAVLATFWVHGIVPHLSGKQTRRAGTVQRVIGGGVGNRGCAHFVVVHFAEGDTAKICTEDDKPWFKLQLIPEAIGLKEGDGVVVTQKQTLLGTSADLTG